jgi:hypothetical protein
LKETPLSCQGLRCLSFQIAFCKAFFHILYLPFIVSYCGTHC